MLYREFKEGIKTLGFFSVEEFADYVGVSFNEVLEWEEKDSVPYIVSFVIHLLKGENDLPSNSALDSMIEECLPLANLLEEVSALSEKLEEMFELQKKLNDSTNGKNWELRVNKHGKDINWLRCVHMEVAELIDSTPWKHWKNINSSIDLSNIHIELVDIWHFIMSYLLQETNIPKAVSLAKTHCIYEVSKEIDYKLIVREAEKLSYLALAIDTDNMPVFSGIDRFIEQFFRCCKYSGLTFNWLQKIYIGKNCLNQFRQDNGYKEGTYIKVWNGKEDNVVMMEVLENQLEISFDSLYEQLSLEYSKCK